MSNATILNDQYYETLSMCIYEAAAVIVGDARVRIFAEGAGAEVASI
jgi:hypothetical protein